MVETYSSMGLVMALYVAMIVSFCFLHVVDASALSICIVLRAFVVVISMCLLYVSLGSRIRRVHPVAILSAVFCVICRLLMFVSDTSGDHNGGNILEYGSCYGFVCCDDRFLLFPPCC